MFVWFFYLFSDSPIGRAPGRIWRLIQNRSRNSNKNIGKSVRYTRRPSTVKRNFAGFWRPSRVALLSSTCCTVSPQTYCAVSSLSPIGNINRRFCTATHTHMWHSHDVSRTELMTGSGKGKIGKRQTQKHGWKKDRTTFWSRWIRCRPGPSDCCSESFNGQQIDNIKALQPVQAPRL